MRFALLSVLFFFPCFSGAGENFSVFISRSIPGGGRDDIRLTCSETTNVCALQTRENGRVSDERAFSAEIGKKIITRYFRSLPKQELSRRKYKDRDIASSTSAVGWKIVADGQTHSGVLPWKVFVEGGILVKGVPRSLFLVESSLIDVLRRRSK